MKSLEGKKAVITGGTAGIGRAIAQKFAEQGAEIVIIGTNAERGAQVVAEIGEERVKFYALNVSKTKDVEATFKEILDHLKEVDILVNNAGITRDQLLIRMSEEDWDDVLAVNTKSCYNCSRALVRHMMKRRKGKIINISSVVGQMGNAGQVNYAASKAAVIGFTKALAKELASRGIQVNCISPGFIETAMTKSLTEQQQEEIHKQIPLGRMGQPEEVAEAALFLANSHSNYITGQVLTVDGGMVM